MRAVVVLLLILWTAAAAAEPQRSADAATRLRYCWCRYKRIPPRCEQHAVTVGSRGQSTCKVARGACADPRSNPPAGKHREQEIACYKQDAALVGQ